MRREELAKSRARHFQDKWRYMNTITEEQFCADRDAALAILERGQNPDERFTMAEMMIVTRTALNFMNVLGTDGFNTLWDHFQDHCSRDA